MRRAVSSLWSSVNGVARFGARHGWPRPKRLPVRVVSVGNLQAGGSGKTPLVARIANEADERGTLACVLTRGYRSRWEREGGLISPGDPQARASECGDEAALLQELAPRAYVGVGADRVTQFWRAYRRSGERLGLVILDDGFQHHKIQKDLEIVALTSRTAAETVYRDFPSALAQADLAVWTKGGRWPAMPATGRKPAWAKVRYELSAPVAAGPFWLVTAVGDGRSVKESAVASGFRVEKHRMLPDHRAFGAEDCGRMIEKARAGGLTLLVTGKDWVKWREHPVALEAKASGALEVIEPRLVFESGRESWEKLLWSS